MGAAHVGSDSCVLELEKPLALHRHLVPKHYYTPAYQALIVSGFAEAFAAPIYTVGIVAGVAVQDRCAHVRCGFGRARRRDDEVDQTFL